MSACALAFGLVDWRRYGAALFDLDEVLTPTAALHQRAWAATIEDFMGDVYPSVARYGAADYTRYLEARPRHDGVRLFLASRGIELAEGSPDDPPTRRSVHGVSNRKNLAFNQLLVRHGVRAYLDTVLLLDRLREMGIALGVATSSSNATTVLAAAGIRLRFDVLVDGHVAAREGLWGKPAPDTIESAAAALGARPEHVVAVDGSVVGITAAVRSAAGMVIGVDRSNRSDALTAAGAGLVARGA